MLIVNQELMKTHDDKFLELLSEEEGFLIGRSP